MSQAWKKGVTSSFVILRQAHFPKSWSSAPWSPGRSDRKIAEKMTNEDVTPNTKHQVLSSAALCAKVGGAGLFGCHFRKVTLMRRCGLCVVIAIGFCFAVTAAPDEDRGAALRRTPIVDAVERVRGSVVNISTERVVLVRGGGRSFFGDDVFDRLFEDFFGRQYGRGKVEQKRVQTPLGSGCILTADGLVVTNEHVIRRASNIKLSLHTGETFDAELLAADPTEDIALLRAKVEHPLQAIPMGTSSDMMLGETILALGNPFGFENSVTSGIVSAFNREIEVGGNEGARYAHLIQTSALINPGNSGGPLVNVLGELVGINTAVVDQAQGIGFSIPIDHVRDVLAPLVGAAGVSETWVGFRGETAEKRDGVLVTAVKEESPAAGTLAAGDVIRKADGAPVGDMFDLLLRIFQHEPGETLSLTIERDGKVRTISFALGKRETPPPLELLKQKLGLKGQNMTATLARQLGAAADYGVLVTETEADSPAAEAGLEEGDIVIQIGSHPVRNLREAASALQERRPGERVFIRLVRGRYVARTRIVVR